MMSHKAKKNALDAAKMTAMSDIRKRVSNAVRATAKFVSSPAAVNVMTVLVLGIKVASELNKLAKSRRRRTAI